ncbi:MAG: 50S ribosomal protein L17 [Bacilli bacterium]|nr:50S ribosomal protein L17 [Bacilli bacterium]
MAANGRKNVHGKTGVRFKAPYTASKKKSQLRNNVTALIINGEVKVTSGVTKDLKALADRMVTYAKKGDLHARRLAARVVREEVTRKDGKSALVILFEEIGPKMAARKGGYTKAFKLGERRGDGAEVTLVRWSE